MIFMESIRSVCVFCASSNSVDTSFLKMAFELGQRLAKDGIQLIYGGASIGLMGEVARGVHNEGGRVTGVLPEFFKVKDIEYSEADELIITRDMRERKAVMDSRSDAFIVLPGGIGTLEEALEILSMIQLRITEKPLVFINTNRFYDSLMAHFQSMVDLKFAKEETLQMFAMCQTPKEAIEYLKNYRQTHFHKKWL